MTFNSVAQIVVHIVVLAVIIRPLGAYMARVYSGQYPGMTRHLKSIERFIYHLGGVNPELEMTSTQYSWAVSRLSLVSLIAVYGIQRTQSWLPWNPQGLTNVESSLAFNTAVSFVTNTNWQSYSGEVTLSGFTQMFALTVQNFVSAAVGMAVLIAFIRGIHRTSTQFIGNFWVDLTRGTLYILLPASAITAFVLVGLGVVQSFPATIELHTLENTPHDGVPVGDPPEIDTPKSNAPSSPTAILPLGPVASQVAIKQLGTNGGGYFNTNSAHPLENPTPLSNFVQMISILLIPAALCHTFGEMVQDRRQGTALLTAMTVIFLPLVFGVAAAEQYGNPALSRLSVDQRASDSQSGGNMEGKETRFGITNSALWAVSTTAASNGSVNAMHDSFTPLGGLIPMWLIQLGEIVFGGVGSGLYGMIVYALIAVFVAGLMVGRTPEYLGKKIGSFEMRMAALVIILPCAAVLIGTAAAVMTEAGRSSVFNPGPHGFSEVLYAYSSAGNNNGSAFAGLCANTDFYNVTLGVAMLIGRFFVILPVLAVAGSLAQKTKIPSGAGTMPTHTTLFVSLLVAIVLLVGALSFFPVLALGPVVEHLELYVH
ncbi:MAG: potassium-transporting ATPase subunit KdpA [Planctomyces sp.]|nr:potassium-transporting ATPase subunit KdpA [Planctomyces sp.]